MLSNVMLLGKKKKKGASTFMVTFQQPVVEVIQISMNNH